MGMVSAVVIETDDVWASVYRNDPFQLVDLLGGHFVGADGIARPATGEKSHHARYQTAEDGDDDHRSTSCKALSCASSSRPAQSAAKALCQSHALANVLHRERDGIVFNQHYDGDGKRNR